MKRAIREPKESQWNEMLLRLFPELHEELPDGTKPLTTTFTFQVTEECNLKCKYCYQGHKTKKVMSWDTAKKAVDMLLSATPENNSYINPAVSPGIIIEFIGGEPFLQIDLISDIADYFCREARRLCHPWAERHMFSICSNGVLYSDPRVQRFLHRYRNELSFSITIDGNRELHDSCRVFPDGSPSYDIAVAAAKDWMGKGHYLGSKITIAPGNVTYLYDALTHMVDLGYRTIHANCVYEKGWECSHATEMYYQLKRFADWLLENDLDGIITMSMFNEIVGHALGDEDDNNYCGGNGRMLCVDPSGHYATCIRYLPSSLGTDAPPLYFGDVDHGIGATEEDRKVIEDLRAITRRSCSTDECFYCPIASGCGWCSGLCYQENGTANKRVTHICVMHQSRILANAYYWNRHYRKYRDGYRYKLNIPEEWALKIIPESEWNMLNELAKEV